MNEAYSNRELDLKFESVHEKLDALIQKADYTNGKLRKIIIVIAILGGVCVGLGLTEAKVFLPFLV